MTTFIEDVPVRTLAGDESSLAQFKGKVLLIVNLASQSTYRDQISALNDLQNAYGGQGLVVVGIPSSDFGGKELKDVAAVRRATAACTSDAGRCRIEAVTLFRSRLSSKGAEYEPLLRVPLS